MADEDISSLIPIEDGSLAKAKPLRQNFTYLDNRITAQATNISNKESISHKGTANGYCPLDSTSKIPSTYMSVLHDEITTALQGKADVDLSNTTPNQTYKDEAMGWAMPDYTKQFSIPSPWTATSDGYIYVAGWAREESVSIGININGLSMALNATLTNREGGHYPGGVFPVGKGSVTSTWGWVEARIFIPCKGVEVEND